ncbi:unnamed protein product [Rotaria socialis]
MKYKAANYCGYPITPKAIRDIEVSPIDYCFTLSIAFLSIIIFPFDEEIDGVAMMELKDEDVEQLLSVKQPDGTTKKPTIGAKRTFEAKLNEWKREQKARIAVSRNSEKNRSVLVLK